MNARKISDLEKNILTYKKYLSEDKQNHTFLVSLARSYVQLAEFDKNRQKTCFEEALTCLNLAISLDEDDYDPMNVIARARLLIKIDKNKLTDQIKEADDILAQIKRDKMLLEISIDKVNYFDKSVVMLALQEINEALVSKTNFTDNNMPNIYSQLGVGNKGDKIKAKQENTLQQAITYKKYQLENQSLKKEIENLSDDDTEKLYQKLNQSNLDEKKNNKLLKKIIHKGIGPYASLAVKLMCNVIDNNASDPDAIDIDLNDILQTKEKYLSIARENCPVIGYYLTTIAYGDIIKRMLFDNIVSDRDQIYFMRKDMLKYYFLTKHFILIDRHAHTILANELRNDLNKQIIETETRLYNEGSTEENKYFFSLARYNLNKFNNPLDRLEKALDDSLVPTTGIFAEEANENAELIINKLPSTKEIRRVW